MKKVYEWTWMRLHCEALFPRIKHPDAAMVFVLRGEGFGIEVKHLIVIESYLDRVSLQICIAWTWALSR